MEFSERIRYVDFNTTSVHKCLIDIVQHSCSYKYLKLEKPSGFSSVKKSQFKLTSHSRTVLSLTHTYLCAALLLICRTSL